MDYKEHLDTVVKGAYLYVSEHMLNAACMLQVVYGLISQRRQQQQQQQQQPGSGVTQQQQQQDLLDALLAARDEDGTGKAGDHETPENSKH